MTSKRQAIDSFRQKLQERNADSNFSNQFLYNVLMEHAKWLIKREVSAGRIYINNSVFTPYTVDIIEVSTVDSCLNIKTNCKIYRSKNKIPEVWNDNNGAMIRSVSSVDNSTDFFYTNISTWQSKLNDPYQQKSKTKYSFFYDGYIWIPQVNPHKVILDGFFVDDPELEELTCDDCEDKKDCIKFLDTKFMVPDWIQAEMYAKALEQVAGITKRLPEDQQIDKNTTRKS